MHYHLIGIAGTAMASLATLLREKGHKVTGSDQGVYPPMSTLLDESGIVYARSYSSDNLEPRPDMVVVGNAITRGNEELEAVMERRIPYTSAALVLKEEFLRGREVVAVAGTHGKTTTTSMIAWLLESAGFEPSFLIGGVAPNFGRSARLTDGEHFVIEADEYDTAFFDKGPKMWHYLPWTAVVTNVEFDHADIYKDAEAYRFAFERFVNLVPRPGTLVVGWDTPVAREISQGSLAPVVSVDLDSGQGDGGEGAGLRARDVEYGADGTTFELVEGDGTLGRFRTRLTGAFNVRNTLAAAAAARASGLGWGEIRKGLASFEPPRRRMEVRGSVGGVTVIDDFAHHPTSVRGTIEAVRQRFPEGRIVAVFEPRSYTAQRREFQEGYRTALGGADRVVVAGLARPERYDESTGLDPDGLAGDLRAMGVEASHEPDVGRIVGTLLEESRPDDVILVMSNGGFGGIHQKLLDGLAERA